MEDDFGSARLTKLLKRVKLLAYRRWCWLWWGHTNNKDCHRCGAWQWTPGGGC